MDKKETAVYIIMNLVLVLIIILAACVLFTYTTYAETDETEDGIPTAGSESESLPAETPEITVKDMPEDETPEITVDDWLSPDLPEYWQDDEAEAYTDTTQNVEILARLESIDYNLRVVSGFVVLVVIGWFIWYTVLKPLRMFI